MQYAPMGLGGRREAVEGRIQQLVEASAYPAAGLVISGSSLGSSAAIRLARTAPAGILSDFEHWLDEAEVEQARRRAEADRYRQEDERRAAQNAPLTAEEQAERAADLREIAEQAAFRRSPEGQNERMIGLLERIATSLERR
jgi:hypothetical protein